MDRIIDGIIARRKAVVAAFLTVAVVCAAMIPFVGVNYDMVDYLPDEAQSTTAVSIMNDEFAQAVPTPMCSSTMWALPGACAQA